MVYENHILYCRNSPPRSPTDRSLRAKRYQLVRARISDSHASAPFAVVSIHTRIMYERVVPKVRVARYLPQVCDQRQDLECRFQRRSVRPNQQRPDSPMQSLVVTKNLLGCQGPFFLSLSLAMNPLCAQSARGRRGGRCRLRP